MTRRLACGAILAATLAAWPAKADTVVTVYVVTVPGGAMGMPGPDLALPGGEGLQPVSFRFRDLFRRYRPIVPPPGRLSFRFDRDVTGRYVSYADGMLQPGTP